MRHESFALILLAALAGVPTAAAAQDANCRNTGSFDRWLADFKKEAAAQGISAAAINAASPYLVLDRASSASTAASASSRRTSWNSPTRCWPATGCRRAPPRSRSTRAVFAREEKEFGVPAAVITGFWGLESDFGAGQGNYQALKSLTTLAYDCRRSDMFRGHLFDALRMIERGDLRPEEMIGSWAGELGQTQMMPSEYYRDAVDYDGDGRRNLIKSAPDVIGSTGKYLVFLGWKRGEPWLQEVHAPANVPWEQADLSIQHPRAQWAAWGVTQADGRPLPSDNLPASLRAADGPFRPDLPGLRQFPGLSEVEPVADVCADGGLLRHPPRRRAAPCIAAARFPRSASMRPASCSRFSPSAATTSAAPTASSALKSRVAVREMQIKFGLPANSWPTAELLSRLRSDDDSDCRVGCQRPAIGPTSLYLRPRRPHWQTQTAGLRTSGAITSYCALRVLLQPQRKSRLAHLDQIAVGCWVSSAISRTSGWRAVTYSLAGPGGAHRGDVVLAQQPAQQQLLVGHAGRRRARGACRRASAAGASAP